MSLTMLEDLVTLIVWRLFGRDEIEISAATNVNGVCTKIGAQDLYFLDLIQELITGIAQLIALQIRHQVIR